MREWTNQEGVVARPQLQARGWTDNDIRRAIRRRELTSIHRGVYVDHTGVPSGEQRAWAAVLYAWPAALCDVTALRAFEGRSGDLVPDEPVHVAVDRSRTVAAPAGVTVHYLSDLEVRTAWHLGPPRLHHDEAVIDVALRQARRLDTVTVLSDAVGSRRTTAPRLIDVVRSRSRVRDRAWVLNVLRDIDTGTWSVLEHGYLTRVERPHGLPPRLRQVRQVSASGTRYRDVELDGRHFRSAAGSVTPTWSETSTRPCRHSRRYGSATGRSTTVPVGRQPRWPPS